MFFKFSIDLAFLLLWFESYDESCVLMKPRCGVQKFKPGIFNEFLHPLKAWYYLELCLQFFFFFLILIFFFLTFFIFFYYIFFFTELYIMTSLKSIHLIYKYKICLFMSKIYILNTKHYHNKRRSLLYSILINLFLNTPQKYQNKYKMCSLSLSRLKHSTKLRLYHIEGTRL